MMMKHILHSSALALLALLAAAAPAGAETLDEAMRAAIEGNPSIAAQRARLEAAEEAVPQARAAALPSLTASADTGASRSRFKDGTTGAVSNNSDSDWGGSVSASQTVFASGGVVAGIRRAKADVQGARADYRNTEQQFLLDVTGAYVGYREALAIVQARTKSAENLEEQRKYAKARFDSGLDTRTDYAAAEARLAQARTNLIQAQGQLAAANETYRRLVGHPPAGLVPVAAVAGLPADLPSALDQAVHYNPVLISARANEDSAKANLAAARSNFGPTVTLQAGSSFSSDYGGFADRSSGDSIGVRLSIPLFTGGLNASRARQAGDVLLATGLERNAAEDQLREQVTTAWTNLSTARAALISAQQQVEASELAYKGVTLEQKVGLRAFIDVFDTEDTLLTARLQLASAEADLAQSEREMLAAIGRLEPPADAVVPKKVKPRK